MSIGAVGGGITILRTVSAPPANAARAAGAAIAEAASRPIGSIILDAAPVAAAPVSTSRLADKDGGGQERG